MGIHLIFLIFHPWIPAFAGMTEGGVSFKLWFCALHFPLFAIHDIRNIFLYWPLIYVIPMKTAIYFFLTFHSWIPTFVGMTEENWILYFVCFFSLTLRSTLNAIRYFFTASSLLLITSSTNPYSLDS